MNYQKIIVVITHARIDSVSPPCYRFFLLFKSLNDVAIVKKVRAMFDRKDLVA